LLSHPLGTPPLMRAPPQVPKQLFRTPLNTRQAERMWRVGDAAATAGEVRRRALSGLCLLVSWQSRCELSLSVLRVVLELWLAFSAPLTHPLTHSLPHPPTVTLFTQVDAANPADPPDAVPLFDRIEDPLLLAIPDHVVLTHLFRPIKVGLRLFDRVSLRFFFSRFGLIDCQVKWG
jgi:hypothetical protein